MSSWIKAGGSHDCIQLDNVICLYYLFNLDDDLTYRITIKADDYILFAVTGFEKEEEAHSAGVYIIENLIHGRNSSDEVVYCPKYAEWALKINQGG